MTAFEVAHPIPLISAMTPKVFATRKICNRALGGGRVIMVSMKIVSNIELFVNWGAASALGVVLLVATMVILWIASRFLNLEKMTGGGH
jgi:ABC-type spermidine/putrescine transport system permease subunit I